MAVGLFVCRVSTSAVVLNILHNDNIFTELRDALVCIHETSDSLYRYNKHQSTFMCIQFLPIAASTKINNPVVRHCSMVVPIQTLKPDREVDFLR